MLENIRKRNNYFLYYSLLGVILLLFYLVSNYFFPMNADYYGPESNFWTRKYLSGVSTLFYLGSIFLLYGIVRFVIFYISFKKNKKKILQIQRAKKFLDCKELYLFLSDDYVLKYNNIVKFYEYGDFIWMYAKKNKERKSSYLNVDFLMKNGKLISTKNFEYNNINANKIDDLINFVKLNNPNIVVGYTDENIKYFKDRGYKVY